MKDIELFNNHFQNYKVYGIHKAQIIYADVSYILGDEASTILHRGGDK